MKSCEKSNRVGCVMIEKYSIVVAYICCGYTTATITALYSGLFPAPVVVESDLYASSMLDFSLYDC